VGGGLFQGYDLFFSTSHVPFPETLSLLFCGFFESPTPFRVTLVEGRVSLWVPPSRLKTPPPQLVGRDTLSSVPTLLKERVISL